jgi:hypothetical protein
MTPQELLADLRTQDIHLLCVGDALRVDHCPQYSVPFLGLF